MSIWNLKRYLKISLLTFCKNKNLRQLIGGNTIEKYPNNHKKDVKDTKTIPIDKHFNQTRHNFNLHAIFIITEQLQDIEKTSNEILKERLKTWETFWNAVHMVQVQLSSCMWNPKWAMTSSSFLMSDLFKLTSDQKKFQFKINSLQNSLWPKIVGKNSFLLLETLFSLRLIYIYIYVCMYIIWCVI